MWRRRWRSVVVLTLIVSFMLLAAHVSLLKETPSQQRNCPFCQWLQNLVQGTQPAIVVVGVPLIGRASPEPVLVLSEKPHHLSFLARSPPSA